MKYPLLLIICFISFNLLGNKDSLIFCLGDPTQSDSARMNAGHLLIKDYYLYESADSALILVDSMIQMAGHLKNKAKLATFINQRGQIYHNKGDYQMAINSFQASMKLHQEVGNYESVGWSLSNIAVMYEALENFDSIYFYYHNLHGLGDSLMNQEMIAVALFGKGYYYAGLNNYVKALEYYLKCAAVIENEIMNKADVFVPYHNIGVIFESAGELEKAASFYLKEVNFLEKYAENDIYALAFAYSGYGHILRKQGNRVAARKQITKALNLTKNYPELYYAIIPPLRRYVELLVEEKADTALYYIDSLIYLTNRYDNKATLAVAYSFKGEYYLQKRAYGLAKKWCEIGFQEVKETSGTDDFDRICDCLYKANKLMGNTNEALFYFEELHTRQDSLINKGTIQEMVRSEMQYSFDKQKLQDSLMNQQRLVLLEKDKEVLAAQNQNYIIGIGAIGLLSLLVFGFYFNTRRKNQQITQQKSELEQLNITKDRLFAIISHDLRKPALAFRGISKKVKFLIRQQDFKTLDQYGVSIEKAAFSLNSLLDNLLNWALQQRSVLPYKPMAIKVEAVTQEIFDLFEQMATDKNIALQIDIPASTTIFADLNAYTTIVRNLIDNAIKYTPSGGQVKLSTAEVAEGIAFKITDTGKGIADNQITHLFELQQNKSQQGTAGEMGTGLGLVIVKDLVALNKGVISVESKINEGTTFEVILPAA